MRKRCAVPYTSWPAKVLLIWPFPLSSAMWIIRPVGDGVHPPWVWIMTLTHGSIQAFESQFPHMWNGKNSSTFLSSMGEDSVGISRKGPHPWWMLNKWYPLRIILSNPSLLLCYSKMQRLHTQQTALSQGALSRRSSISVVHWTIQPTDFWEPSEFSQPIALTNPVLISIIM